MGFKLTLYIYILKALRFIESHIECFFSLVKFPFPALIELCNEFSFD
jgi:hypothetical protein